jgi:2-succinyl-6-hydroxy-2,4-cyclohexadiene-1-carboxylate synthase
MTTVLLHGFLGAPSSWDEVVSALPSSERVVRPSLMGHTRTASDDAPSSFDGEVDRIALGLDRERVGPVHLVGYSMGARVALVLALRHPQLVARLTLVSGLPGIADDDERRVRARLDDALARELVQGGLPAFVARWETLPLFASQRDLPVEVRARHRAVRLSHDEKALARALEVLTPGRMPVATPRLGEITARTLLVAGALDAKFVAVARSIEPLFPDARVRILPDTGHDPTLERPRELAALITENAP